MRRGRLARGIRAPIKDWLDEPQNWIVVRGRLMRPYRHKQFHSFGAGSVIHRPDWIYGPRKIGIGSGCVILKSVWLSAERPAWSKDGLAIELGNRVGVRPYCTISAAESIVIEDNVVISAFTSILDSDHTFGEDGSRPVWEYPMVTEPVRIGRGSWIGERVTVLKGSRIGVQCAIGANSVVRGEIPDYSVAVGVPARVVGTTRKD